MLMMVAYLHRQSINGDDIDGALRVLGQTQQTTSFIPYVISSRAATVISNLHFCKSRREAVSFELGSIESIQSLA